VTHVALLAAGDLIHVAFPAAGDVAKNGALLAAGDLTHVAPNCC
jgi:hypothetical protein